jgi:uncharacterized repeat protein (TIGR01451 family)
VTCALGNLANSASATVTIVVRPTAAGTLSNTASVTGTEPDPTTANNTATATTTVTGSADLALTNADAPDPVTVGQNLTYTIGVTNNGPSPATGVTVSDTLPSGVTFVSASASQGSCSGTSSVICALGNLANSASATVTIVVRPTAAGTLTNTATVSGTEPDPAPANNTATTSTTVTALTADLSITKADAPDPVIVGQTLTYTLTATNSGPSDATGVTVTDTLPGGVTLVSASASQGNCSGTNTISCSLGNLTNGSSATVTIRVTPTTAGTLTNTASIQGGQSDPNTANNTATATTTANAVSDLAITKTDSPDPVLAGQTLTYTIGVSNGGPSPATAVTVTDALPSGVSLVSAAPSQGTCSGTTTVACTLGAVAQGANATVTIMVRPNVAGTISNTVNVTGAETDTNPANNSASASTTITPAADLVVSKTGTPNPVTAGQNLTYTIAVTNNGPSPAANPTLSDTIPNLTTFQSLTPASGWNCTTPAVGATGTMSCSSTSLASGATASFSLVVKPPGAAAGTTVSNTATASSATTDPATGNNSATVNTAVVTSSQLDRLSVSVQGGQQAGTVTSSPSGIICPGDCSEQYPSGISVTLTATPASGWTFNGWGGDCSNQPNPCTVVMNGNRSVQASFRRR